MFISPVTFRANPISTPVNKAKTIIPDKENVISKLNNLWKDLDQDPINEGIYNCIKKNEAILKNHYPEEYKNYRTSFRLI